MTTETDKAFLANWELCKSLKNVSGVRVVSTYKTIEDWMNLIHEALSHASAVQREEILFGMRRCQWRKPLEHIGL